MREQCHFGGESAHSISKPVTTIKKPSTAVESTASPVRDGQWCAEREKNAMCLFQFIFVLEESGIPEVFSHLHYFKLSLFIGKI